MRQFSTFGFWDDGWDDEDDEDDDCGEIIGDGDLVLRMNLWETELEEIEKIEQNLNGNQKIQECLFELNKKSRVIRGGSFDKIQFDKSLRNGLILYKPGFGGEGGDSRQQLVVLEFDLNLGLKSWLRVHSESPAADVTYFGRNQLGFAFSASQNRENPPSFYGMDLSSVLVTYFEEEEENYETEKSGLRYQMILEREGNCGDFHCKTFEIVVIDQDVSVVVSFECFIA